LSNPEHSRGEVQKALAAGKTAQIVYTYRAIEEAMHGALNRAKEQGRAVPISTMIQTHHGSAMTVASLFDEHRGDPRVRFRFVDNSARNPKVGTLLTSHESKITLEKETPYMPSSNPADQTSLTTSTKPQRALDMDERADELVAQALRNLRALSAKAEEQAAQPQPAPSK
jgi:hypothetical protein